MTSTAEDVQTWVNRQVAKDVQTYVQEHWKCQESVRYGFLKHCVFKGTHAKM